MLRRGMPRHLARQNCTHLNIFANIHLFFDLSHSFIVFFAVQGVENQWVRYALILVMEGQLRDKN